MKRQPTDLPAAPAPPAEPASGHRIVTSQHRVSARSPELSELEFGVAIASNAYSRWWLRGMTAPRFTSLDGEPA
jgi:predicted MarR family transcription regulator